MSGDEVKKILENNGFQLNEVAEKIGISPQNLNNWLNVQDIKTGSLSKIATAINKSVYFFLQEDADIIEVSESISTYGKDVPYWNLPVSAGRSLADVIGKSKPDGYISGLPNADIAENILPVTGTSMEPEINPGALIGVRLINNWETLNTERIYLIITIDDRMIKRIEHDTDDEKILWCVSPNYPKFKIYKNDIIEIQRVCFVYNPK